MIIKIENLTYIYNLGNPFEKKALDNINLEINEHLNGLMKPTSGKIIVDGVDITSKDANLRSVRQKVGLVFQYPEHQLFEETVWKDIAFGPINLGLKDEE